VITLPKRKLRLWYNKNDYLKDRENERKLSEQNQIDNVEEPSLKAEKTESIGIDNNSLPVENKEASPVVDETKLPVTETQNEILPEDKVANQQQAEPTPEPVITQEEASGKENIAQIEPNKEIEPRPTETQLDLIEKDTKPQPTEKEAQETSQIDNIVAPIEAKQKEEFVELKWVKDQDKLADPLTRPNPDLLTSAVESIQEAVPVETENKVQLTDSVVDIGKYTDSLKRLLPTKAVVCIGEYPINIVLKSSIEAKREQGVLPIFVEKSTKDVIKWSQGRLDKNNIVCLDEDIDTHFWYDILPYVVDNENFFSRIKSKPIEKLQGAIIVSSTWNGIGSALLPSLNAQFKEWSIYSMALPILPSKATPLDGQFNTFASLGILASKQDTALLLVERDNLESYIGVDRNGYAINGNSVTNYLLDLMLAKETFVAEMCEISKSFSSKMFTVLLASGLSLKIYGSIENMLDTTLLRPLLTFDLSTSTLLYAVIRLPFNLKDTLTRGKIELAIANWFENKADLESIYIADPIYVEETNDRIDIALFVGGFETTTRFATLEKKVEKMKNKAIKKGSITEEDWKQITKSLLE
jgi:hypothetical protein